MTATTGMSMAGKMSTTIRVSDKIPITRINTHITATVYGRRSASRTIHIESSTGAYATKVVRQPRRESFARTSLARLHFGGGEGRVSPRPGYPRGWNRAAERQSRRPQPRPRRPPLLTALAFHLDSAPPDHQREGRLGRGVTRRRRRW